MNQKLYTLTNKHNQEYKTTEPSLISEKLTKNRHTLEDHQDYLSLPFPIDPVDL